jgi:hypothetical protein
MDLVYHLSSDVSWPEKILIDLDDNLVPKR